MSEYTIGVFEQWRESPAADQYRGGTHVLWHPEEGVLFNSSDLSEVLRAADKYDPDNEAIIGLIP